MAADPVTVVCSLWKGWQPIYTYRHVNALRRMVARHLPEARFVCYTDQPEGVECETYRIPVAPRAASRQGRNCYWRLWFFSADAARRHPGVLVNLDLDCLIRDELSPLLTDHDFRILRANVCPYNGGFWMLRTGTRTKVWSRFNRRELRVMYKDRTARRWVGSDQAWIAWVLPDEAVYTGMDGIRYVTTGSFTRPAEDLSAARIVFCPGSAAVKPWSEKFAALHPDLHAEYMSYF